MSSLGDSDGLVFRNYSCSFYCPNNFHTFFVSSLALLFKTLPSLLTRTTVGNLLASLLHAGWHSALSDTHCPAYTLSVAPRYLQMKSKLWSVAYKAYPGPAPALSLATHSSSQAAFLQFHGGIFLLAVVYVVPSTCSAFSPSPFVWETPTNSSFRNDLNALLLNPFLRLAFSLFTTS